MYEKVRGIRNNNPGNIRRTSDKWQGLAADQTDSAFFQFTDAVWGIRALAKLVNNYYTRYGLNTVRGIISRWAPSNENDTDSYVESVADYLNVQPDDALNVTARLDDLTRAIIRHENGVQPYANATINQAITLI